MYIQHNMAAISTRRELNVSEKKTENTTEHLASGYRINRAADDAAGLQISEKMRYQVRGLEQAARNANDGISLIQTADAALGEMHSVLNRMNELSVQAANDTNQDIDRDAIQNEINEMMKEIDRISETTTFNNIPILQAQQPVTFSASAYSDIPMTAAYTINDQTRYGADIDFDNITLENLHELIGKQFSITCGDDKDNEQTFTLSFTDASTSNATINGNNITVEIGCNNPDFTNGNEIADAIYDIISDPQTQNAFKQQILNSFPTAAFDPDATVIGYSNGIEMDGSKLIFYSTSANQTNNTSLMDARAMIVPSRLMHLQTGANAFESVPFEIRTINSTTLNLTTLNVDSFFTAGDSITAIQRATQMVSDYRTYLGAIQNRLEHTVSNVKNTAENTMASESRLRDADMADEMVDYSKYNILMQAGQSILAQNNQSLQSALSILQ